MIFEEKEELIDMVLYGDIHEAPWSVLGDRQPDKDLELDKEQITRVSIAATIEDFFTRRKK